MPGSKHIFYSIALVFVCFSCQPNLIPVVKNGVPNYALTVEKSWASTGDCISGTGLYHLLYSYAYIHDADFHLKATLELERVDSSTALLLLFNNHFGFDSKAQKGIEAGHFFFYSPDRKWLKPFDVTNRHIQPKTPFFFEVIRKDSIFEMKVNRVSVAKIPLDSMTKPLEGYLAFRPWTNKICVYDWEISGKLDLPEKPDFVFERGENDYACFRIPAIIKLDNDKILAFAEGRKDNCWTDAGDIDIVMKFSSDNGKTWSPMLTVWNDGSNACQAPTPILDHTTGKIVLLACKSYGKDDFKRFLAGKNEYPRQVFALESSDDGQTWTKPRNITEMVMDSAWWWYGTGPGSGLQLENSAFKNRLIAATHFIEKGSNTYRATSIYSDDSGATWQRGTPLTLAGGNESEIAELPTGELVLNSRNYSLIAVAESNVSPPRRRMMAKSLDGGATWIQPFNHPDLIEPICQASLLAVPDSRYPNGILFFSNPPDSLHRINLTVKASIDAGKSWPYKYQLFNGPSAYSDLVELQPGWLGCLFECGGVWPYEGISFKRLDYRHWVK